MKPSELDPKRYRQIDAVFDGALDLPPQERDGYLDAACAGDPDLRGHVEALLDAQDKEIEGFDRPITALVSEAIVSREDLTDRRIGPFELLREIGRGGMGIVYLAEDTRLGRQVALKALPPYLGMGADAKERFRAEARAVSALDHPNIATLFEVDETPHGQLYMVFALYDGETLSDRIQRGRVPPAEALEIATAIARGLAAAHEREIVHRDVKPSNVMLTEGGAVKLLDFGVAKVAGAELTSEDARLGTLAYMSPEQAAGDPIDHRSDLWSLGVVLFEMLTGRRPPRGPGQTSLTESILGDDPGAFSSDSSGTPRDIAAILGRLLHESPDHRYQSAQELLADLDATPWPRPRVDTSSSHAPVPSPSATGSRASAAVLVVLVVVGTALWTVVRPEGPGTTSVQRLAVLPLEDLTGDPDQRHVVEGIHSAMTADLGQLGRFAVLSRTSVMPYRDSELSVTEIARELGVDAVVEGALTREGDRLTLTSTLIAASPEAQLWTRRFPVQVGTVFEVSGEVARSIAAAVDVELSSAAEWSTRSQGSTYAAEDAYFRGLTYLDQRSRESFELARNHFRRAIELDSTFAPAFIGLAKTFGSAASFGQLRPSVAFPEARRLSERALSLDGRLAEAHMTLAAVRFFWDWDAGGAEAGVRRALSLNPSDADSHRFLSQVLSATGRHAEGLAEVDRARALDRLAPIADTRPVLTLYLMRDFEGALARAGEVAEFHPRFWQLRWLTCLTLAALERYAEAVSECETAADFSGQTPMALSALGYAYAVADRRAEAELIVEELRAAANVAYVGPSYLAAIHGALGEPDIAFQYLDQAYDERDVMLVQTAHYAFFDPLRTDPRLDDLIRRIGLIP